MNILHIISDIRRGGRERQLSIMISHPIQGVNHYVIAFYRNPDSYIEEYGISNVKYISKNKIIRLVELYRFIKNKNIEIIYSWGGGESFYALIISLITKVKFINGAVRHGVKRYGLKNKFTYFLLKFSKYAIANSYAGLRLYNLKNNKSNFVLYNGIEEKFFITPNQIEKKKFLIERNKSENSMVFISIANLVPHKDYTPTLVALNKLKNDGYPFFYIIIGKGQLLKEIESLIGKLNLESQVQIFADNPNIPELLSISDIFIHSSAGEGCSNAILEAMAAGLIIVASNTGGTNEIIGNDALLYGYKNVNELYEKLKIAIQKIKEFPEVKNKIRLETKNKFSVENFQKEFKHILGQIQQN